MSFCINCGQELAEGAKFCANCGTAVNNAQSSKQRETTYDGKIHKCPNCGEILESYATHCKACGYELRDISGVSSVKTLAIYLEQLEQNRPSSDRNKSFLNLFGMGHLSSTDQQKIDTIKNYSIPNTKEDVMEFLIFASSSIDASKISLSQKAISDAWIAKYDQAFKKAQILFVDTQDYEQIQKQYAQKMKQITKEKKHAKSMLMLPVMILFWIILYIIISCSQ